ncbi:MAG: DNA polymerase III subunit beta [Ruminococcaceae bacterium]|nr:DNA polymerase III subunit beta [Oscillospiraceae bacterium]
MKITFEKEAICTAVIPLFSGISNKNSFPAADGILIEAGADGVCVLTTYDFEKGVRVSLEADVIEPGDAIINAAKFSQTVRAMEGSHVTLTVDSKNCATIVSGKSSHTMSALSAKDFPEIPRLISQQGFHISGQILRNMISKCIFAMGVNDQRVVLNGLFFHVNGENLKLVSCDSFKMAVCGTNANIDALEDADKEFKFIVPNRSVTELYKLLGNATKEDDDVCIYINRKNIIFVMGDVIFFSKLIEGEYINYDRIILKNHRIMVYADRENLLSALERAALITEEKVAGSSGRSHVKLETGDGILKISANSGAGSAYDEVSTMREGDDIVIAFNNRYLMDCLRACTADRVRLSLSSALASMNIEPADPETEETAGDSELFMLLPVRMKD